MTLVEGSWCGGSNRVGFIMKKVVRLVLLLSDIWLSYLSFCPLAAFFGHWDSSYMHWCEMLASWKGHTVFSNIWKLHFSILLWYINLFGDWNPWCSVWKYLLFRGSITVLAQSWRPSSRIVPSTWLFISSLLMELGSLKWAEYVIVSLTVRVPNSTFSWVT